MGEGTLADTCGNDEEAPNSGHGPSWRAPKWFDNIADLRRDEDIVRDVP